MRRFTMVVFLAGLWALSVVSAWSQAWVNPGTTDPPTACQPFDDCLTKFSQNPWQRFLNRHSKKQQNGWMPG